nr:MAG TPA: hypothetical protein [Bacteriophage sp.]
MRGAYFCIEIALQGVPVLGGGFRNTKICGKRA